MQKTLHISLSLESKLMCFTLFLCRLLNCKWSEPWYSLTINMHYPERRGEWTHTSTDTTWWRARPTHTHTHTHWRVWERTSMKQRHTSLLWGQIFWSDLICHCFVKETLIPEESLQWFSKLKNTVCLNPKSLLRILFYSPQTSLWTDFIGHNIVIKTVDSSSS